MSDQLPVLSNANLLSSKNLTKLAIAVPVAGVVFWLTPWWLILGGGVAAGYSVYHKLNTKKS